MIAIQDAKKDVKILYKFRTFVKRIIKYYVSACEKALFSERKPLNFRTY